MSKYTAEQVKVIADARYDEGEVSGSLDTIQYIKDGIEYLYDESLEKGTNFDVCRLLLYLNEYAITLSQRGGPVAYQAAKVDMEMGIDIDKSEEE